MFLCLRFVARFAWSARVLRLVYATVPSLSLPLAYVYTRRKKANKWPAIRKRNTCNNFIPGNSYWRSIFAFRPLSSSLFDLRGGSEFFPRFYIKIVFRATDFYMRPFSGGNNYNLDVIAWEYLETLNVEFWTRIISRLDSRIVEDKTFIKLVARRMILGKKINRKYWMKFFASFLE